MTRWAMVIDLDKCVACQGCTIACRQENNTPVVSAEEAQNGRAFRWNDVFPFPINAEAHGQFPNITTRYMTRPCMHCDNAACIKVCPVQATYRDEDGLVRTPDIELSDEMSHLIVAQRSYQANVSVFERARDAYQRTLDIGR